MTLRRIPTNSFRKLVHVASRAIIVASLFLLQALPSVASPQTGDLSEQGYSVANPYCNAQSNTPAEHRHEHSSHCLFCCFNQSRDDVRCCSRHARRAQISIFPRRRYSTATAARIFCKRIRLDQRLVIAIATDLLLTHGPRLPSRIFHP